MWTSSNHDHIAEISVDSGDLGGGTPLWSVSRNEYQDITKYSMRMENYRITYQTSQTPLAEAASRRVEEDSQVADRQECRMDKNLENTGGRLSVKADGRHHKGMKLTLKGDVATHIGDVFRLTELDFTDDGESL